MLLAVIFTFVLHRAGLFTEVETTVLDTQTRMDMPAEASNVVIVDITNSDFSEIFKGKTRPLNLDALHEVIDAIAQGQPCVIGVDIDTQFEQFKDFKVSDNWSNVVWSRSAEISDEAEQEIVPLKVLGREDPTLNDKSGLPILEDDEKGVTRFYSRLIKTTRAICPRLRGQFSKKASVGNARTSTFRNWRRLTSLYTSGFPGAETALGAPGFPLPILLSLLKATGKTMRCSKTKLSYWVVHTWTKTRVRRRSA